MFVNNICLKIISDMKIFTLNSNKIIRINCRYLSIDFKH